MKLSYQGIFKNICVISALIFTGMWIYRFLSDEDTTTVDNKSFFVTDDDKLPVMSMCFKQSFDNKILKGVGENTTAKNYKNYLRGKYFDENMVKIDYHSITTNISDFIISYKVYFLNGTSIDDIRSNVSFKAPYYTYSWSSWGHIVKCFGLEITDPNVKTVAVYMTRDIFPRKMRPAKGGFAILFHYPNQVLMSYASAKRTWNIRNNVSNYMMGFNLLNTEVNILRYKPRFRNCVNDWKNFDKLLLQNHIDSVGCKSPYFGDDYKGALCKNKRDNKNAVFYFSRLRDGIAPCRSVESLYYTVTEADYRGRLKRFGKYYNNWFSVILRIRNSRFKALIQKKEVDFQCLVGYVGGYLGMFTGFAITQIPDTILGIIRFFKRCLKRKNYDIEAN